MPDSWNTEIGLPSPGMRKICATVSRIVSLIDRPFRAGIDRLPIGREVTGDRAGDNDIAGLALRHVRYDGMNILHDGVDVEIEHLVDGFRRRLGEIDPLGLSAS